MASESRFLDFLVRNLTEDDLVDIVDNLQAFLDSPKLNDVVRCISVRSMILKLVNVIFDCEHGKALIALLCIEQDYNFIAIEIRRQYHLYHDALGQSVHVEKG